MKLKSVQSYVVRWALVLNPCTTIEGLASIWDHVLKN